MSRMRFLGILLGALIALIVACLIVSLLANWRQIGDLPIFALMFVVLLGAAGLIPFCLGLLIQGIFRKRMIPGICSLANLIGIGDSAASVSYEEPPCPIFISFKPIYPHISHHRLLYRCRYACCPSQRKRRDKIE